MTGPACRAGPARLPRQPWPHKQVNTGLLLAAVSDGPNLASGDLFHSTSPAPGARPASASLSRRGCVRGFAEVPRGSRRSVPATRCGSGRLSGSRARRTQLAGGVGRGRDRANASTPGAHGDGRGRVVHCMRRRGTTSEAAVGIPPDPGTRCGSDQSCPGAGPDETLPAPWIGLDLDGTRGMGRASRLSPCLAPTIR